MKAPVNAPVDRRSTAGIILVVLGLMFFAAQWFDFTGAAVLGALSVFFVVMYATTRKYGFLIPGMILGGLAVGVGLHLLNVGQSLRGFTRWTFTARLVALAYGGLALTVDVPRASGGFQGDEATSNW